MNVLLWAIATLLAANLSFTCVGLFDPWLDPQFNNIIDLEEPRFDRTLLAFSLAKMMIASIGVCALCVVFFPSTPRPRLLETLLLIYGIAEVVLEVVSSVASRFMDQWALESILASAPERGRGQDPDLALELKSLSIQLAVPLALLALTALLAWLRNSPDPTGEAS